MSRGSNGAMVVYVRSTAGNVSEESQAALPHHSGKRGRVVLAVWKSYAY